MSNITISLTDKLYNYLQEHCLQQTPTQKALANETAQLPESIMQITPYQGKLMQLLINLTGAKRIIEIGVFTGYSALAMAISLPEDGELIACDINKIWTDIAKRYWQQAGVAHKIKLYLQPALKTLGTLTGSFDMAFVDADKANYLNYYEKLLPLIKQNGLLLFDNVLWGGRVIEKEDTSEDTLAIRALNSKLINDARIELVMLPIGDGLTIARKL